MKPVVEVMYMDFLGVCLDMLLSQAAKLRFMTGGRAALPLVVRTQFGVGRSSGSQHSQSLEALLAHIPGLTVVMPANPADTYGLLRAAIQDPNPVVFIEDRLQYGLKCPRPPFDYLAARQGQGRQAGNGRHPRRPASHPCPTRCRWNASGFPQPTPSPPPSAESPRSDA
jgi:pyruvate/2-oxoglutarate/acetoin dehydrogenase E1 component